MPDAASTSRTTFCHAGSTPSSPSSTSSGSVALVVTNLRAEGCAPRFSFSTRLCSFSKRALVMCDLDLIDLLPANEPLPGPSSMPRSSIENRTGRLIAIRALATRTCRREETERRRESASVPEHRISYQEPSSQAHPAAIAIQRFRLALAVTVNGSQSGIAAELILFSASGSRRLNPRTDTPHL